MNAQLAVYVVILNFAAVLSFTLAAYSNLRKTVPAARPFGVLSAGIGLYTLFYMFEIISIPLSIKEVFFTLKYIGITMMPVGFLWFTLEYTGWKSRLTRYGLIFTAAFCGVFWLVVATNPWHEGFYTNASLEIYQSFVVMGFQPRAGYYVFVIYITLLALVCFGLLVAYFFRTSLHRRQQVVILLTGAILPLGAAIYILLSSTPWRNVHLTSLAFALSVPLLSLGVFRYRMLDVVPEVRTLILESMDDSVIVINRQQRIIDLNPAAERFLGVSIREAIGVPLKVFFPEWESITGQLFKNERYEQELEIARGDEKKIIRLSSWQMSTWWGGAAGRLVLIHDISEFRQMEQHLLQAKEAAEAATRAKSLFLAHMSHEIRTPINAVLGMTNLLLNTRLEEEQTEYVQAIRTAGSTLLTVINEVLDYSKIEAGRVELQEEEFDLETCLEDALEMVAPQAASRGLKLTYWIDPLVYCRLSGDEGRVRQILINLLANAVKFTESGSVKLEVEKHGENAAENRLWVHFRVADTGIGIAPERLPLLFEEFSQADKDVSHRFGGSGLGLAICRRLVEAMGGKIWAESQPGKGSTFHFIIPFSCKSTIFPIPQFEGKRMLILTADADTRRMLESFAARRKLEAISPRGHEQVLSVLSGEEQFDFGVMELHWQGEEDQQVIPHLWQYLSRSGVPWVLLKPFGSRKDGGKDEAQFAAVLHTPVKFSQLTSVLETLLHPEQSKASRGTRFSPPAVVQKGEFSRCYPLKVLVVDDNALNRKVVLLFLQQLGYSPTGASSGEEALQWLQKEEFDLVLLDVQMPGVDGLETARRIRSILPKERQPVLIALTAFTFDDVHQQVLEAGMDECVYKPLSLDQLKKVLLRVARQRHGGDEAVPEPPVRSTTILQELGEEGEEIGSLFREEIVRNLMRLDFAWQAGVIEEVGEIAHSLKSACAFLGDRENAQLCGMLERHTRSGQLPSREWMMEFYQHFKEHYPKTM